MIVERVSETKWRWVGNAAIARVKSKGTWRSFILVLASIARAETLAGETFGTVSTIRWAIEMPSS